MSINRLVLSAALCVAAFTACDVADTPQANDNFDAGSDSGKLIATLLFINDVVKCLRPEIRALACNVGKVSDIIIQYFRNREMVAVPECGHQWPVQEDCSPAFT